MSYTAAVINLGCKVNKYEADLMKQLLADAGIVIVEDDDIADFYIVNTCSVTNIADKKSRQMLRRAKRRNPNAIVIAAGCYVNAHRDQLEEVDYVDLILGNNCKNELLDIMAPYMNAAVDVREAAYIDIGKTNEYEELGSLKNTYLDHQRAYIKIQDGCNQFCSYCIIPYTRGRVRCRSPKQIIAEISELAKNGVKEFVLTGIHISSYEYGIGLADLIYEIAAIAEVKRIRLGSLEPRIITRDFLDRIINIDKLCPHFHLSLQSACNSTLKRMNRKYTIEEYIDKCTMLREYYDKPAITTDVIVGFPGETDEEFEITLDNLKLLNLYEMHVFKYSVRSGTVAERLPNHVPECIKNKRSECLLDLAAKQRQIYETSLAGISDEVLVEDTVIKEPDIEGSIRSFTGYTKRYVKVYIESENSLVNEIVPYTY